MQWLQCRNLGVDGRVRGLVVVVVAAGAAGGAANGGVARYNVFHRPTPVLRTCPRFTEGVVVS